MRRMFITGALIVALALAGCGGDDDAGPADEASTTAQPTTTTTEAPTPDEQFLTEVDRRLTFGEADGPQAALDLAHSACDTLDMASPAAAAADDAANDTPESDAAISSTITDMGLATIFEHVGSDEVAATVLVMATDYFCPQHATTVQSFILGRGLELPETDGSP